MGSAVVEACGAQQWGIAQALLEELSWSPEELRREALFKARSVGIVLVSYICNYKYIS